jgi:hypothetical protein
VSGKADINRVIRRQLADRDRNEQRRLDRFGRFGTR